MSSDLLCAIPARSGSERLPEKNIKPLSGKPMLAYSIETAFDTGLFDEVFVCTDDPDYADIAREYGATVPVLMPEDLCGPMVPSHEPCQYLAAWLEDERGDQWKTLVCLQPTSPLRASKDIIKGVEKFSESEPTGNETGTATENRTYDFVVSATKIDPHYFHWAIEPNDGDSYWSMYFGDQYMRERPLLPQMYRPNGSVKIADIDALADRGNFFGDRLGVVETPEERSIHVGTAFDFELCEFLLERDSVEQETTE